MPKFSSWIRYILDQTRPDTRTRRAEAEPPPTEKKPEELYIDWGQPIPEWYDRDRIGLLVQDPYRLFCYWELSADAIRRFFPPRSRGDADPANSAAAGERSNHLVLTLHNLTDGVSMPVLAGTANSWWFHVSPDREYRASLQVRWPDGRQEPLISSNEVHTPRDTVSWGVEPFELLREENMAYLQLLTLSGAEPVDRDFLEMLRSCQAYDRVFVVPECLLKYLPEWLRQIIRKLNFNLPFSIFVDFVLKRYFPEFLHRLILESPELSAADLEPYALPLPGESSLVFYPFRPVSIPDPAIPAVQPAASDEAG